MWPPAAGTLRPGGGGIEWVKVARRQVSRHHTWLSIGHVARVSPAPLSRDNYAAVPLLVAMVTGVRLGRSAGQIPADRPGGAGEYVVLGQPRASRRPLEVFPGGP